jgi:molecular chaperone DnaK
VPQVEVTFDIDANGIVNVSAKDRATGRSQAITITSSSGLGKDEVERMVQEAQSHADDDRRRQEEIESRNRADSLIYSTEKTIRDHRDKLPAAEVEAAENAVAEARKAVEAGGKDRIEAAVQDLTRASHRLAEVLYKSAEATPPAEPQADGAGSPKPGDGEDVVDAEVVDNK